MAFALCGCGKSEAVKGVEEKIAAIGTVNKDSGYVINSAERAYSALSDKEKNQVENYGTLVEARRQYNSIPIELTASNLKDYLIVNYTFGKTETETSKLITNQTVTYSYSSIKIDFAPNTGGSFSNVKITAEFTLPKGWRVDSNDAAYDKEHENKLIVSFSLPATGNYSEEHSLIAGGLYESPAGDLNASGIRMTIVSVEGSFKRN